MKLCIDCRWHRIEEKNHVCRHPDAGVNPVGGAVYHAKVFCLDARCGQDEYRELRICGLEARLWEAK